jgi:hypothetical protein
MTSIDTQQSIMSKTFTTLVWLGMTIQTMAQWNADPAVNNLVASKPQDQQDARLVSDGAGGAIITWVDFRDDVNQNLADIYVQRVDADGNTLWSNDGLAVCANVADQSSPVLVADGAGGAVIVWQDWRNGDRDIYAQRVSANGAVQWDADGVAVVSKAANQGNPRVEAVGVGEVVVAWEDSINGNWDIYAQKLNSSGIAQWTTGGVAICVAAQSQINQRLGTTGNGNTTYTWQDKRNGQYYVIYAQMLNASGTPQWATDGVTVATATDTQSNPKLEVTSDGSTVIAWQQNTNSNGYDVKAQKINGSGAAQWGAAGVDVCATAGNQSAIDMTSEGMTNGELIISWKDGRTTKVNIYSQKLNASGAAQWAANGVLISSSARNQNNPNAVGDGQGGAIVCWQDSVAGIWDVYAQRITTGGNVAWATGGLPVGIATDNQTNVKNVSDGNGGSIFSFQDKRSGDFDIYAYKLDINGQVTAISETHVASPLLLWPNPTNGTVNIDLASDADFTLIDATGRELWNKRIAQGRSQLDVSTLPRGIYMVRAEINGLIMGQRLVVCN